MPSVIENILYRRARTACKCPYTFERHFSEHTRSGAYGVRRVKHCGTQAHGEVYGGVVTRKEGTITKVNVSAFREAAASKEFDRQVVPAVDEIPLRETEKERERENRVYVSLFSFSFSFSFSNRWPSRFA